MSDRHVLETLLADAKRMVETIEERLRKPFTGEADSTSPRIQMADAKTGDGSSSINQSEQNIDPGKPMIDDHFA